MTQKEALVEEVLRWDRIAIERGLLDRRPYLWRILDALDGRPVDARVIVFLNQIDQSPTVVALREALGIDESPMWAGRVV